MKSKKGQLQQVFIYIMVILIVGAVLLFGYKSINKLMGQSCNVDMATFKEQTKARLQDSTSYGVQNVESLKSPCGYEVLCFVNSSGKEGLTNIEGLRQISSGAADEVLAGTGSNVFLVKGSQTESILAADYLDVLGNSTNAGWICVKAKSSSFNLYLDGIGKGRVRVTPRS